ncbi:DUF5000 domain-containing lipoprotein [Chitinophaga sp.]|uniref:DUF5000 domain-containing lipoprotein n=1 Tax=Chitinophaga sp. TaxID=1869181 RepID=UPI0031E09A0E
MKKYLLLPLLIALLQACREDDQIGQYAVDKVPPGPVTGAAVENVAGGAIIRYNIPADDDLLYVKAVYQRNGKQVEQKTSVYDNQLLVEGLGKSQTQAVTLTAYDRSGNPSSPVSVDITPLDAPIFSILETMKMQADFGGIRLNWANQLGADVIVTVITREIRYGVEEYAQAANFYTKAVAGVGAVRGYSDEEREFGVYIHDRWNNVTDTVFGTFKPFFEEALDKKLFRRWNPPGIPYSAYTTPNWYIENLWNDRIEASPTGGTGFANFGLEFTFDMGQMAKISRFKINQRPEPTLLYNYAHPKKFELWGSPHPNVNADFSTWIYLGTFESIKPSGLPLGQLTDEDLQYAHVNGEEWNMPLDAKPVRYIRFVCKETWAQANDVQVMELSMWGDTNY